MLSRGVIPDSRFYRDLIRTQHQTADDATLNELVDKTIDAGVRIAPAMTAHDCRRLLNSLTSRPASALHAWRAMLQARAKLPLDRELFTTASGLIAQAGDAQASDEHESAMRELFGGHQN
jgi:hypothetical protein